MRRMFPLWLLLLPPLTGGCLTHKLWTESDLDEWNEPGVNPGLRLFRDEKQDDFLVLYDEYSDRYYTTHERAFFLKTNEQRLRQHREPVFSDTNAAASLPSVPIYKAAPTNVPDWFYAVNATNSAMFDLYSGPRELGTYSLPFYDDGEGRMERILWTPLTATVDLTIIGGVVAIICWDALAESNGSVSVN